MTAAINLMATLLPLVGLPKDRIGLVGFLLTRLRYRLYEALAANHTNADKGGGGKRAKTTYGKKKEGVRWNKIWWYNWSAFSLSFW